MVYEPLYLALQLWQLYVSFVLQISKGRKEISIFCRHLKKTNKYSTRACCRAWDDYSQLSAMSLIGYLPPHVSNNHLWNNNVKYSWLQILTTCFAKSWCFLCHFTMSIQAVNCIVSRLIFWNLHCKDYDRMMNAIGSVCIQRCNIHLILFWKRNSFNNN